MYYPNLEAELKRQGITRKKLASMLGIHIQTVSSKLTGKSQITLDEATRISESLGTNNDIKYLFETRK